MTPASMLPRLFASVSSACPLLDDATHSSLSVSQPGVNSSVKFSPAAAATPAQISAAQTAINNFDWSDAAQAAWQVQQNRTVAQPLLSDTAADHALLRAVVLVLVDEINFLRAAVMPALAARTPAQARTAILAKLNSGAADQ